MMKNIVTSDKDVSGGKYTFMRIKFPWKIQPSNKMLILLFINKIFPENL